MNSGKGLTPVIASVLLITVTVAAAGSLYTLTQEVQESNRERVDVSMPETSDLFVESCFRDSSFTNLSVRNSNDQAINASVIIPFVEGRPAGDYSVNKQIVNPGDNFIISINKVLADNKVVKLVIDGDKITYVCS